MVTVLESAIEKAHLEISLFLPLSSCLEAFREETHFPSSFLGSQGFFCLFSWRQLSGFDLCFLKSLICVANHFCFASFLKSYLFETQCQRDKQVFHLLIYPLILCHNGHGGPGLSQHPRASSRMPREQKWNKRLIHLLQFSQDFISKLEWKWSNQDLNWCPYRMLALRAPS